MKRDGRALAHNTLEEMRILAGQRLAEGEHPNDVAASFGMHRSWAYRMPSRAGSTTRIQLLPDRPARKTPRSSSGTNRASGLTRCMAGPGRRAVKHPLSSVQASGKV